MTESLTQFLESMSHTVCRQMIMTPWRKDERESDCLRIRPIFKDDKLGKVGQVNMKKIRKDFASFDLFNGLDVCFFFFYLKLSYSLITIVEMNIYKSIGFVVLTI